MSSTILKVTCGRIHITHAALLKVTEDLTIDQFTWLPGPESPPIGWHLWHIARWADRVQEAMPERNGIPRQQIWVVEELAQRYALAPDKLGAIGSGEGMAVEDAISIPPLIGQENILNYARRSFATLDGTVDELTSEDLAWLRPNCRPFTINDRKQVVPAPAQEGPVFDDLAFHISHASRHLGMIEGLRGAMNMVGTASV